ncbi:hypothetical protein [Facklamia miroungae]|uniref:Peptidase family M28 n=1 Tax=Facklamia miroungae TaxID=120956 RepID=A0A1G7UDE7_9LACT|nr:hypothetical protein [Facklamia miroungae]NKZ30068.1 hypothetical protein [Facklamia miroungae]SDG45503.1 hypothetical protein SAMN05421791_10956 [Facklamia miroungae]
MLENKRLKDWLFRYQYIYKIRKNIKSKERFITALVADIMDMRNDLQVIEYGESKKERLKNIYVGDIEQADRIICAHYDTPVKTLSSYIFFDKKRAKNKTSIFILISSILMVLFGLGLTLVYKEIALNQFQLLSLSTLLIAVIYAFYFYFLNKISRGIPERNNLIRNTSSILTLLALIKEIKDDKTAFVFYDRGVYGTVGLQLVEQANAKNASIYVLDSIGSDASLYLIGKDFTKQQAEQSGMIYEMNNKFNYNYLISARRAEIDGVQKYYLSRSDLKQKELNMENINKIIALFNNKER